MTDPGEVKTLAFRSAKWAFLPGAVSRFSQPLVNVILAWFLIPEDYGIVAMATLVTGLAGVFQGMGLSQALVQREGDVEKAASVTFFLNALFGAAMYAVILAAAPMVAGFFSEARVVGVLRVQGVGLVLSSLGSAHIAILQRRFQFRKLFWITLLPALVPVCVAVPLAAAGFGYWALVTSFLVGLSLQTAALWVWSGWRPKLTFDMKLALGLVGFGGLVALETLQEAAIASGGKLIVGRFMGAGNLGKYVMGFNLAMLAIGIWIRPFSAVAYSSFCRLRSDRAEMGRSYMQTLEVIATGVIPLSLGLSVGAGRIVPLLLGPTWEPIVPVVRILAIMPGLSLIMSFKSDVYRAMGRPDIMPKVLLAQMVCIVPIYMITARHGLSAFCWGRFSADLVFYAPHIIITMRLLGLPRDYFWRCVRSPLLASVVMAAVLYGLLRVLGPPTSTGEAWAGLLGAIASSAVVYATALTVIDRALSRRLLRIAGRLVQAQEVSG